VLEGIAVKIFRKLFTQDGLCAKFYYYMFDKFLLLIQNFLCNSVLCTRGCAGCPISCLSIKSRKGEGQWVALWDDSIWFTSICRRLGKF